MDDQRTDREGGGGVIRYHLRFSVRAMLVVMTLIAVGIGAYIAGYKRGFHQGYQSVPPAQIDPREVVRKLLNPTP